MAKPVSYRQIIRYHSEFGHLYVPNIKVRMRYGNTAHFLQTDRLGFRNSPSSARPGVGARKIILLGDSYAAGAGVSNAERFSNLLEQRLDCQVTNLAVNGYGVDQQLLVYEHFRDKIAHDFVLFAPHMDDLNRNMLAQRTGQDRETGKSLSIPKPYFSLWGDELKLCNVPVPLAREFVEVKEEAEKPARQVPGVVSEMKNRAKHFVNARAGRHVVGKLSYQNLNDGTSEEWKLMRALLKRLLKATGSIPVLMLPLPYNYPVESGEPQYYEQYFKEFEDERVQVAEILPSLQKAYRKGGDKLYLPLCGHFSAQGHEVVADFLLERLTSGKFGFQARARSAAQQSKPTSGCFVLGVSCFYHDSACALLKDGQIVAAAQEERFSRVKHDASFPENALHYCLEEAGIQANDLAGICYYDDEAKTIERVLHNVVALPEEDGIKLWGEARERLKDKVQLPSLLRRRLGYQGKIFKTEHHISHAASAFYPSPFDSAAILILDGVGEWACSTIAQGQDRKIKILRQQNYPHSLGLLYSAFTSFCGFKVNSGEYKLMGLAPYGDPVYLDKIKDEVLSIAEDGSIRLNLELFDFQRGLKMTNEKFAGLFGGEARKAESRITQREMDLAASIQAVTEEIIVKMAEHARTLTGEKYLVMAGGVALNCVANGKLLRESGYEDIWIQPASGDAGGALGAALQLYYGQLAAGEGRRTAARQEHSYYGPGFSSEEIVAFLETSGLSYHRFDKESRAQTVANWMREKRVIGYFDGRMEFGPRALGHRSIVADPTDVEMQSKLNLKIKYRESFRPFAPIVQEKRVSEYFEINRASPFMLLVAQVQASLATPVQDVQDRTDMIKVINQQRSLLPAITHVDNSARIQTLNGDSNRNPDFHDILEEFQKASGYGVLVNTSFNVRGEPIVCTPMDAYRCFMRTEMDILVLGPVYLLKTEQPDWEETEKWQETFVLD